MKISVAIATYNRRAMVRESVEAALEQTLLPDEIVVSDDASTDGTAAMLEQLATRGVAGPSVAASGKFGRSGELEHRDARGVGSRRLHRMVFG